VLNTCWWSPVEGGGRVYGGVRADAEVIQEWLAEVSGQDESPAGLPAATRAALLATADLPLSAVGDTLTLPATLPAAGKKPVEPGKQADAGGEKDPGPKGAATAPAVAPPGS
jgi:hypothetical protein